MQFKNLQSKLTLVYLFQKKYTEKLADNPSKLTLPMVV